MYPGTDIAEMHAGVTEHRRDCVSTPYTEKLLFLQKHVNTDHVSFMIFFFFFQLGIQFELDLMSTVFHVTVSRSLKVLC